MMSQIFRAMIVSAIAVGASFAANAQTAVDVKFSPGNYGTRVNGAIVGNEIIDYRLGANAGLQLFVELDVDDTNGDGTIYFNILPPGSTGEAIYVGSNDTDNSETVALQSNGTYTIRVYLMGNDRDTDKTVGYGLDISIQ